jgi:hypothetical protein
VGGARLLQEAPLAAPGAFPALKENGSKGYAHAAGRGDGSDEEEAGGSSSPASAAAARARAPAAAGSWSARAAVGTGRGQGAPPRAESLEEAFPSLGGGSGPPLGAGTWPLRAAEEEDGLVRAPGIGRGRRTKRGVQLLF